MSSNGSFPIRADPSMEVLPPDSPIRQIYPEDLFENGSYAPLLHGRVRYWIIGPEDGMKACFSPDLASVVLIHGVSTPSVSWKAIGPYLAAKGFRVLIYDLFGKGYSEAPHMPSDATLFVTQLALLMQYVRWEAAHIVGFSMGGGVAAAFTASLPHLVAGKTLLIASAGLIETGPTPTSVSSKVALLQYQDLPGYKRSLASCFTDGPIRGLQSTFDKLDKLLVGPENKDLQVLVIHGTDDEIVPYEEAHKIKARIPEAEVITVEGAGHDLVLRDAHWRIVGDAIVRFLEN
ncbi:alpha/beta-hydrolase [Lentinus tigrinus ALCF2SS1-6]|uniref:Alpha/beta-hydrolase n=1 Tax=Lentinus tigrinus ALCF2SS1-6 TaxID=1328759 RepID=A0A5C2SGU3_9APHY|nr:alpha/beta-hydrolase [Lentinus tigrinus ALCF2SS1-6]